MIRFLGRRGKAGVITVATAAVVGGLVLSQAGAAPGAVTRAAGATVSVADEAAATSYNGSVSNDGAGATVYDYPGSGTVDTSLASLETVPDGTQVSIQCYLTGTPVSGPNGQGPGSSDAYWDQLTVASTSLSGQLAAGHAAIVPDAYINTGRETVNQVVPACDSSPGAAASPSADSNSANGVPPGESVTVLNVTTVAAPAGAAVQHCRAEIQPALLMNAFIPQGIRLAMNPCLRNWLAAGVITSGALAQILANTIPAPWSYLASLIADVINNSNDAISALFNDTCGYWAYLYVTWAPPLAWASCSPDMWGGWIHGN
jgi:hypothetical protein